MRYDPSKLRALRDNIDRYLSQEDQEEQRIYEALEKSIGNAVKESLEPVLTEFRNHLDTLTKQQQEKKD